MSDYVPLSSFEGLPSPHDPVQRQRDPWFVWGVACAPVPPLITLALVGSTSHLLPVLLYLVVLVATAAGCVALARADRAAIIALGETRPASPWLAIAPAAYLLVRAARRAMSPHRGNPMHPLVLNLVLGFVAFYYLMLFLAAITSIVNYRS